MDFDGTVRMRMQDGEWRVERMEDEDVSSPSTIVILKFPQDPFLFLFLFIFERERMGEYSRVAYGLFFFFIIDSTSF